MGSQRVGYTARLMNDQHNDRSNSADIGNLAIRVSMLPRDTNPGGTIFGGVILSQLDIAGGIEARKHADKLFVTVAIRGVEFIAPVYIGDVISFYTAVVREGTTSVTVKVSVEAERGREPRHRVKVTEAEVIYVAVDEAGNPTPLK